MLQDYRVDQRMIHPINKYSPYYANYMGIKSRATTSAKLTMTGLMRNIRKR
jgi:hypothetical protein